MEKSSFKNHQRLQCQRMVGQDSYKSEIRINKVMHIKYMRWVNPMLLTRS